jgi:glutamyl-tRNA synthetase
MVDSEKIKKIARKYAIHNAYIHDGKARIKPTLGKIISEIPESKTEINEVISIVEQVIEEINIWSIDRQKDFLVSNWPELMELKKKEEKKRLPPLKNVERFNEIRTRFAPNPDGPLHLGSAEPIIFCDEYAKMYEGKFILRFEDTSPDVKKPISEMYDWIIEDIEWLGVQIDEIYFQSERLEIYYRYTEELLSRGSAYVCTCKPAFFKKLYVAKKACPCRNQSLEENLNRWEKMLNGYYNKGEAVVRIKTDLNHPNPAIRDWPALRIATSAHPRKGKKYRVWPLYNFSCAVDDHEMEISHIIRGKEHEVNTTRQKYLYEHLEWEYPEIINVGRLGLEVGILSKSKIRKGINEGTYSSWEDPRLGTLRALKRRGLQPETIREIMIQVGPKPINSTISWANIAAMNRQHIEPLANRFFFVENPITLMVSNVSDEHTAKLPLHPDHPERGARNYIIKPVKGQTFFKISKKDVEKIFSHSILRLMGLFNIEILKVQEQVVESKFDSKEYRRAREINAPFIHWLSENVGKKGKVIMPNFSVSEGLVEPECYNLKIGDIIQFERFGFVRVDNLKPFVAYYAHR